MTFSSLATKTVSTPNQDQGRGGTKIDRIVLHHMASTGFVGVLAMWTNATREGSANYAVSNEGLVVGVVPEENRSWSLSNYGYDARAITFEIENEAMGDPWPVSDDAHEAVAKVVADICKRYSIPCDRTHIVTHREVAAMGYSYATACPGGLDADRIVNRAQQLLKGAVEPPKELEFEMSFLPFCVQNKEPGAKPEPGIAIFSNGHVEAIDKSQWDAYGMAGAKQYETKVGGHFAFFLDQAAKLRASSGAK